MFSQRACDVTDRGVAIRAAYVVHATIPELLTRTFLVPPTPDHLAFLEAEKQKRGKSFEMGVAAADLLDRLSTRITEDILDLGFLMPATWLQFRDSDPEQNWPPTFDKSKAIGERLDGLARHRAEILQDVHEGLPKTGPGSMNVTAWARLGKRMSEVAGAILIIWSTCNGTHTWRIDGGLARFIDVGEVVQIHA